MKCFKCGAEVPQGNTTCNQCGQSLVAQTKLKTEENQPEQPKKKQSVAGIIVAVLVFIGFSAFGYYNNRAVDQNDQALDLMESGSNYEQALTGFEQAYDSVNSKEDKIEILKNWAYAYLSESDNDNAKTKFIEAKSLADQGSFNFNLISGEIALLDNQGQQALDYFNQAYDLAPDDFQINSTLGIFYLGLDEVTEIFTDYDQALIYNQAAYDGNSQSETMKENLALSYYFLERYAEAVPLLLATSLENKPYNNYLLGLCYYSLGADDSSRQYFQSAADQGYELSQEIIEFIDNPEI